MIRKGTLRILPTVLLLFIVCLVVPGQSRAVTVQMIEFARMEEIEWQRAVVERFNAEHKEIQVELISQAGSSVITKMMTMLAAGTPLDIGYHDPHQVNVWGRQGVAKDLRAYLEGEADRSPFKQLFPEALDFYRVGEYQYGIPLDLQPQGFFYNEDAFDEVGLAYPGSDFSWAGLADWGRRLSIDRNGDGNIDRWAMPMPSWYHWLSLMWSYEASPVDDDKQPTRFTGDSAGMRQALEFMTDTTQARRVMAPWNVVTGGANNIFVSKKVAMAIGNSLSIQYGVHEEQKSGMRWNVCRLPYGPHGTRAALNHALAWFIFNDARNPEEAWEVLRYFSAADAMGLAVSMRGTMVPHRAVLMEKWPRAWESPKDRWVFIEAVTDGSRGLPNLGAEALTAVLTGVRHITAGTTTLSQGIENMRIGVQGWIDQQVGQFIR